MPKTITLAQTVTVMGSFDVVVVGGGPAGCMAALAAARRGCTTVLVERLSFLGGMATGGLVMPVSEFNKNGRRIISGIAWETMERLAKAGAADLSYPIGNVPFDPEAYKFVLQQMMQESGVALLLNTMMTGCVKQEKHVTHILCTSQQGSFALEGKRFIDATGDALLCGYADVPFQPLPTVEECQPATLCFRLGGVDTAHLENIHLSEPNTRYFNSRIRETLDKLRKEQYVPNFGGPWFCWTMREGIVNVNMTRAAIDSADPLQASEAACQLRSDVFRFTDLLKQNVNEFRDCYLLETAVLIGCRESRRIAGIHVLTGDELLSGKPFEDTIACSAHPVDIHIANDSSQHVTFLEKEGYIPYRSLCIADYPNLLVAGRCISADRQAFASTRVQAPCMATGQAAGTAAALSLKTSVAVYDVCISTLQQQLDLPISWSK